MKIRLTNSLKLFFQGLGILSFILLLLGAKFPQILEAQSKLPSLSKSESTTIEKKPNISGLPIDPNDPKKVNFTITAGAIGTQILVANQTRSHKIFSDKVLLGPYNVMKVNLNLLNLLKDKGLITLAEGQKVMDDSIEDLNIELGK